MIKYGLRVKKTDKVLGFGYIYHEESDNVIFELYPISRNSGNVWMVNTLEEAKSIKYNGINDSQCSYNKPSHNLLSKDLEVVKFSINITEAK